MPFIHKAFQNPTFSPVSCLIDAFQFPDKCSGSFLFSSSELVATQRFWTTQAPVCVGLDWRCRMGDRYHAYSWVSFPRWHSVFNQIWKCSLDVHAGGVGRTPGTRAPSSLTRSFIINTYGSQERGRPMFYSNLVMVNADSGVERKALFSK